jgi:hypothetical protein
VRGLGAPGQQTEDLLRRAAASRLKQSCRCGGRFAPAPAVWTTAPRLLLFCLQPAGNLANDGANRPVGGAEVPHCRGRRAVVSASVRVTPGVPRRERARAAAPLLLRRVTRSLAASGSASTGLSAAKTRCLHRRHDAANFGTALAAGFVVDR